LSGHRIGAGVSLRALRLRRERRAPEDPPEVYPAVFRGCRRLTARGSRAPPSIDSRSDRNAPTGGYSPWGCRPTLEEGNKMYKAQSRSWRMLLFLLACASVGRAFGAEMVAPPAVAFPATVCETRTTVLPQTYSPNVLPAGKTRGTVTARIDLVCSGSAPVDKFLQIIVRRDGDPLTHNGDPILAFKGCSNTTTCVINNVAFEGPTIIKAEGQAWLTLSQPFTTWVVPGTGTNSVGAFPPSGPQSICVKFSGSLVICTATPELVL
jgi:hypothetical protein